MLFLQEINFVSRFEREEISQIYYKHIYVCIYMFFKSMMWLMMVGEAFVITGHSKDRYWVLAFHPVHLKQYTIVNVISKWW